MAGKETLTSEGDRLPEPALPRPAQGQRLVHDRLRPVQIPGHRQRHGEVGQGVEEPVDAASGAPQGDRLLVPCHRVGVLPLREGDVAQGGDRLGGRVRGVQLAGER